MGLCREGKNKDSFEVVFLVIVVRVYELYGYYVCYL